MSVRALLRSRREVWRSVRTPDGLGGWTVAASQVDTVRCKVDIPSAEERNSGGQWSAEHTHTVFLLPTADVRRGDELRGGALPLRVLAVIEPSGPRYRKAVCSADQPEG